MVGSLRAKDKKVFDYLYENYSAALYGIIMRIVRDEDSAQEVLHDAFMKIWDKIPTYEAEKATVYTWMARICRNLAIDTTRSRSFKQSAKTDTIADNVTAINTQNSSETATDGIGLSEYLNQLTEDQQFIINLLYFKGYTQSEIAEEFSIPLGTVKTRTRAALQTLRKILN